MASLSDLRQVEAPGNNVAILRGRVALGAAGVIGTVPTGKAAHKRFTIARTSAGIYTITLTDKWVGLDGIVVTTLVAGATPANKGGVWKLDSADVSGAKTIVIRNELAALAGSAAVAVDPPDNATLQIVIFLDKGTV